MNFAVIPTKDHQPYVRLTHSTIIILDSIRLYNKKEPHKAAVSKPAPIAPYPLPRLKLPHHLSVQGLKRYLILQ